MTKAPSDSATLYPVGTKKVGNDGNTYTVQLLPSGLKRWTRPQKQRERRGEVANVRQFAAQGTIVTARLWVVIDDLMYTDHLPPAQRQRTPIPKGTKTLITKGMAGNYFSLERLVQSYGVTTQKKSGFLFPKNKTKVVRYPVQLLSSASGTVSDGSHPYMYVDFRWLVKGLTQVGSSLFREELRVQALRPNTGWGQAMLERARFGPKMVPEHYVAPGSATGSGATGLSYRMASPREEYYTTVQHTPTQRGSRRKLTHQYNGRYAMLFTLQDAVFRTE